MPRGPLRWSLGGTIGILSALMGIGGGVFGVTLMTLCGKPIHKAVHTLDKRRRELLRRRPSWDMRPPHRLRHLGLHRSY